MTLARYAMGSLSADDTLAAYRHFLICRDCHRLARALRSIDRPVVETR